MNNFSLEKDVFGNIRLTLESGQLFDQVKIIRAFPISSPENGFSIVDQDGHELVWFEALSELNENNQYIVRSSLEQMPYQVFGI